MREERLPPATLEGWYLLHQLWRLDWPEVRRLPEDDLAARGRELAEHLAPWSEPRDEGWSGVYRMAGGADLLTLHFRERLEDLTDAGRRVRRSGMGDLLHLASDYVSVVELGLYGLTVQVTERLREEEAGEPAREAWEDAMRAALDRQREVPYVRDRLFPRQPPDKPYVCFYPMSKRRRAGQNWYTLPLTRRDRLMQEHGSVGRRHGDRISQVISGSVGLDAWEWAVTLFAGDPLDFKAVVTEMRYDEASALYADFGAFFVGRRMAVEDLGSPDAW